MKRLTALPVIKESMAEIGAVGKTDFKSIWVASELNEAEFNVVRTHEESHVWLWHNSRSKVIRERESAIYNHALWNIATDMEIARNIYTPEDIKVIKAPRSRISSGIVPDSIRDLPFDLVFAEEIYYWLQENQEQINIEGWDCAKDAVGGDNDNEPAPNLEELKEILASIREVKRQERHEESKRQQFRQTQERVCSIIDKLKNRVPSLSEEISAGLRVRHERPRSYARPSRREMEGNFVSKGRKSVAAPPLIEIYVDRSGSFSADKTRIANQAVMQIVSRYRASIKQDTYYFGNGELRDKDIGSGGDTPYRLIIEHLKVSRPRIAVIITDNDGCEDYLGDIPNQTKILCIPIGCVKTEFAARTGGKDVTI